MLARFSLYEFKVVRKHILTRSWADMIKIFRFYWLISDNATRIITCWKCMKMLFCFDLSLFFKSYGPKGTTVRECSKQLAFFGLQMSWSILFCSNWIQNANKSKFSLSLETSETLGHADKLNNPRILISKVLSFK